MEFPRLMYKSPGKNKCQGGSFDSELVEDQAAFDALAANGWHDSVPEAIGLVKKAANSGSPETSEQPQPDKAPAASSEELKSASGGAGKAPETDAADLTGTKVAENEPKEPAKPAPDDNAPPTRAELLQMAATLNLKNYKNLSDAKLAAKIDAALKVGGGE